MFVPVATDAVVGADRRGAAAAGPQGGVAGVPRDGGRLETERESLVWFP